jgi:coiled-coil domain-containing protein 115
MTTCLQTDFSIRLTDSPSLLFRQVIVLMAMTPNAVLPSSASSQVKNVQPDPLPNRSTDDNNPIARLDDLLATYLDRLDTYQKLREQLSQNLSSGFLSLAHANRTVNLGSGRRYGEEGYDQRMKAGRRVKAEIVANDEDDDDSNSGGGIVDDGSGAFRCEISYRIEQHEKTASAATTPTTATPSTEEASSKQSPSEKNSSQQSDHSPPPSSASPKSEDTATSPSPPSPSPAQPPLSTTETSPRKPVKAPNPLHWYGVLVPPALRAAQASFTTAVEGQIGQLLNVQLAMAGLEVQIRRVREEVEMGVGVAQG